MLFSTIVIFVQSKNMITHQKHKVWVYEEMFLVKWFKICHTYGIRNPMWYFVIHFVLLYFFQIEFIECPGLCRPCIHSRKNNLTWNEKQNTRWVFLFQKYVKFWILSLKHFIKDERLEFVKKNKSYLFSDLLSTFILESYT